MFYASRDGYRCLTVVATGYAAAVLAVGSAAGILLDARGGNAAVSVGDRPACILADNQSAVLYGLGQGGGEAGDGEEDGRERQLHFDWLW